MHHNQIWSDNYGRTAKRKPHDTDRARKLDPDRQEFIREMYYRLIHIKGLNVIYVGMTTWPRRGSIVIKSQMMLGDRPLSMISVLYTPSTLTNETLQWYINHGYQVPPDFKSDEISLYRNNHLIATYPKMNSKNMNECAKDVELLLDFIRSDYDIDEGDENIEQAEL